MSRRYSLAVLLLACCSTLAAAEMGELKPFKATYSITASGFTVANAQVQLEKLPDGRWSYQSQTRPRGLARILKPAELSMLQQSVFRFREGQLVPETFTAEDGTSNDSKDQNLVFDWPAGHVSGIAERKPVDLPTQPGLLDELSVHVALMHALLAGHAPEHFVMLDGDRIKEYLYTAEGQERLKTEVGEYDTVVYRSNRPESHKATWFWCAPELGYLPLKIERRDGRNAVMSMRLEEVTR